MYAIAMAVLVALLLIARQRQSRLGVWLAKPACAAVFLAAAAARAPFSTPYRWAIVAGLVLGAIGDVLLIPVDRPRIFLAGLVAFLLGHVAYVVAFASLGFDVRALGVLLLLAPLLVAIQRWLAPHLDAPMRAPVVAYMVVISLMVLAASGAALARGAYVGLLGAVLFYASDLTVARDRFVKADFANEAVGLPLYFGAQLLLASTL